MLVPNLLEPTFEYEVPAGEGVARQLYQDLFLKPQEPEVRHASRSFLRRQLQDASLQVSDMPERPEELMPWMQAKALRTGEEYAAYLASRKAGQPRCYFSCRSHALAFLQGVAPTKLVDGAWLYGLLQHWGDMRFYPLLRTYLEELGDGDPAQNHVVIYQRLLAAHGCENLPDLSDDHYLQGAVQLALAHHADEFLPEVIGYNLGYEQLPLHLLISAFELAELDIDPYYFTLHVTIDNADSGHARKAVQAVLDLMPAGDEGQLFMERVANGYRLNDLGVNSNAVIESFRLEQSVVEMLERKRVFGSQVHSDFCRIGGRNVSEWLAEPGQIPDFLRALEQCRWIRRHEDPRESRFWRLVDGADAQMFGVFSPFEKQLLEDWIAGDWLADGAAAAGSGTRRFRAYRQNSGAGGLERTIGAARAAAAGQDAEVENLRDELKLLPADLRMRRLVELMAPEVHSRPVGLEATRLFTAALG
ncbi:MAG: iron-containing redox enzyme family protein [Pseudomonas sp.]|nr:iron-containing redox enzyme family protein [Pseudomonas sp.]